jgi:hypothetical protein
MVPRRRLGVKGLDAGEKQDETMKLEKMAN